jgi:hypothetical protein
VHTREGSPFKPSHLQKVSQHVPLLLIARPQTKCQCINCLSSCQASCGAANVCRYVICVLDVYAGSWV